MAARQPFWKWHRWKSIDSCLWPPSTCIWNLKFKFQSKLDLCSGNHVVYRQTDGQTDRRTDKVNPVYPPSNFVGRGYNDGLVYWCIYASLDHNVLTSGVIFTWHFRISFDFSYRKNLLNVVQSFSVLYFGISCSLRFWNFQSLLNRLVFQECISISPKPLCSSCRRN